MRTAIFAIALMASGAALAQTYPEATTPTTPTTTAPISDPGVATDMNVAADPAMTTSAMPSTGQIQAASNANPEHDARGIAVISDAAVVPAGFNGTPATGVGGPLVDPATGEAVNPTDTAHPPCTAEITDNCLQTYERGRSPQ